MLKCFKSMCLLLAVLLIVSTILIGCDNPDNEKKKIDDSFLKNKNEKTTVVFYVPRLPDASNTKDVFDTLSAKALQAFNINLTFKEAENFINLDYEGSVYPFTAKEDFDAAVIYCDFKQLIDKDYIMDITQLFPENAREYYSKLTEEMLSQVSFDGKIYAVPPYTKGSKRMTLVLRNDIVKKFNVASVETIEEYITLLDKIKGSEFHDAVSRFSAKDGYLFTQIYDYSFLDGYLVYKTEDATMKLIPWEQTEEYKEVYDMMQKMHEKGVIISAYYLDPSKKENNLASFITDWDSAQEYTRSQNNYTAFPMYSDKIAPRSSIASPAIVINKKAAHPQEALKIIDWIHRDPEIYKILMYGLEDKNYTMKNERIEINQDNVFYGWRAGNAFKDDDYFHELTTDADGYGETRDYQIETTTQTPPHAGFIPNYDKNLTSTMNRRNAMVPVYVTMPELESYINDKWPTIYDVIKYIEKNTGVDGFLEETQKQLDHWRRNNQN